MNFSFALALWAAFDTKTATLDFLISNALLFWASRRTPLSISINGEWLHIGKAKIERKYISGIEILTRDQISVLRTRDANPDAYLDLRFWVPVGVRITIQDERDYTPYWLISTKSGAAIKAALEK